MKRHMIIVLITINRFNISTDNKMNTVGTGPSPTWQGNTNYNFEI